MSKFSEEESVQKEPEKEKEGCGKQLGRGCLLILWIPLGLFFGLIAISFISALINPSESTSSTSSTTSKPSPSQEKPIGQHLTKEGYYAAKSEEDLGKMTQVLAQKDELAFQQMLGNRIIFPIYPNQKVFLTGCHGTICSIITFRYEGQTEQYWTYEDAITK